MYGYDLSFINIIKLQLNKAITVAEREILLKLSFNVPNTLLYTYSTLTLIIISSD